MHWRAGFIIKTPCNLISKPDIGNHLAQAHNRRRLTLNLPRPKTSLGLLTMSKEQPNNPLHGIKLETVVVQLEEHFGWDGLAQRIDINCFKNEPSVKSSLKFLRRTPWARDKVEQLFIDTFDKPKSPWG